MTDDGRPMDAAALREAERVLKACWQAFDAAVEAATGKHSGAAPAAMTATSA